MTSNKKYCTYLVTRNPYIFENVLFLLAKVQVKKVFSTSPDENGSSYYDEKRGA
jgi:hypothetical protein